MAKINKNINHVIDITKEICPLTFVKTKLAIEKISLGNLLHIRLKGREPLENIPRSVIEHGHTIISNLPESISENIYGIHILTIRKEK